MESLMLYVIIQFVLLMVLAWPISSLHLSSISILGVMFILCGGVVAISALWVNRPGNFNVRPMPKASATLITTGIYHYIRHPMYCSLFFIGLGMVFCQMDLWKLLAWCFLVITLVLKARFEERALLMIYADYKKYQQTTWAFIPLCW